MQIDVSKQLNTDETDCFNTVKSSNNSDNITVYNTINNNYNDENEEVNNSANNKSIYKNINEGKQDKDCNKSNYDN